MHQVKASQHKDDLNSSEAIRAVREGHNTFYGQLIIDKIDRNLEVLLNRFDTGRITDTYVDRAAAIHGGRKALRELKAWLTQ